jgi:hypothetical protein
MARELEGDINGRAYGVGGHGLGGRQGTIDGDERRDSTGLDCLLPYPRLKIPVSAIRDWPRCAVLYFVVCGCSATCMEY